MNIKRKALALCGALLAAVLSIHAQDDEMATFRTWALTPPMGWNSWDCYYSSVTEQEVLQNAQYLVDHDLVKYGWQYVVVDIRWYCNHPSLGGGNYNQQGTQDYVLDEYGRYLPSPSRFPSCMQDGVNVGFKPLAEKLHAMGLKLGIHIMRGVPKSVVNSQYKLLGSEDTKWSQVYSSATPACTWLKDNLTVRNNEYGQLYYNSIMDLYAQWGVDFLKVDDLSRPFYTNEIRMIRRAIDQTGRPMVLSLSPGKTQYTYAKTCLENANMWRMMDDLWDSWSAVDAVFAEAHEWSKYAQPGNYADCDMLPLGQIAMTIKDQGYTGADAGRWTRLSRDEQLTMMTLWGICHSPLFFGGEMTRNDDFTLSLLTNEDYHQMHKHGQDAHQVLSDKQSGHTVWTSTDPATGNRYLALFQRDYVPAEAAARSGLISRKGTRSTTLQCDVSGAGQLMIVVDDWGDGFSYDRADLINPVLIDAEGNETSLTTMTAASYTSDWGTLNVNRNVENGPLRVEGQTYSTGLGLNAQCTLVYDLPEGHHYKTFRALCGYDSSCDSDNPSSSGTTMEFLFYVTTKDRPYDFDLTLLGYAPTESVPVYDVWAGQSLGEATGTLTTSVASHGVKLLRLGNGDPSGIHSVKSNGKLNSPVSASSQLMDLQGRPVGTARKGIYIQNGRKVVVD